MEGGRTTILPRLALQECYQFFARMSIVVTT